MTLLNLALLVGTGGVGGLAEMEARGLAEVGARDLAETAGRDATEGAHHAGHHSRRAGMRPAWTSLGLCARVLPFELPSVPLIIAWHHRYDTDPAHNWLRTHLLTVLETILTTPNPDPAD